ncbi:HET-domain-containing protein [Hypoxylon rubiginosum]|uniref:HET-domain-containing protein n=1 Tax=Hypoxylon rubiginosum TaxID=110542 RepID=A0ACB9YKG5_9PEZI|nr:HET-domain-containing protein [Hypoxylon rubiginosum]
MRLINTSNYELREFLESEVPRYAILSHTWGDEEVSFQDMLSPHQAPGKGYEKIKQACRLARHNGFAHLWVDTCCIDKSSSSELSESINSMFQWYANAAVCYAFIADLPPDGPAEMTLPKCRWFHRGWTLQELLAPEIVEFYDMDWNYRGTKQQFASAISDFTGIPIDTLRGVTSISDSSLAARMSWAAHRQTTRIEDMAYCLLGIFNLNMALLYGEGSKAFRRLQREIIQHSNDLTIFAWEASKEVNTPFLSLLAPAPAVFAESRSIIPLRNNMSTFSVTNKGLLLTGDIPLRVAVVRTEGSTLETLYGLKVGALHRAPYFNPHDRYIYLRKVGPRLFYRISRLSLSEFGRNEIRKIGMFDATDKYILIDPTTSIMESMSSFRTHALHVPGHPDFKLKKSFPGILWDHTDKIFLKLDPNTLARYSIVVGMLFEGLLTGVFVKAVVLCDYRRVIPIFKVFRWNQYPREAAYIFQQNHNEHTMSWEDLEFQAPSIRGLSNWVDVKVESEMFRLSMSSRVRIIESEFGKAKVVSLVFKVSRRDLDCNTINSLR